MAAGPWLNQDHTLGLDHSHPKVSASPSGGDERWDWRSGDGLPPAYPSCPTPIRLVTFAQTCVAASAILQRKAYPGRCFCLEPCPQRSGTWYGEACMIGVPRFSLKRDWTAHRELLRTGRRYEYE